MKDMQFVVTFKVNEEQKESISNLLGDNGRVTFLKSIPEEHRSSVLASADILIAWNPVRELKNVDRKFLRGVKFVQLLSAGYDHIDVKQFPPECIIASNSGAYSQPMAEHIVAMILALYKNLLIKNQRMASGEFDQLSENRSLNNSICGIIGYGGIGKATAELLKPFGVKIYALNTSGKTGEEVDFIGTLNDLDFLLSKSDIIVLTIPLNDKTKGLIGKRELELMKPDGTIINVARGSILKEGDLYNHLKKHTKFLAGIDAWWREPFSGGGFKLEFPFFELPNVLGSPHNSAVVPGALLAGAERAIRNALNFVNNEMVGGIINKI